MENRLQDLGPKKYIESLLMSVVDHFQLTEVNFTVEHPGELAHGDYATNIALVCAKKMGKSPREVADSIVAEFQKLADPEIIGTVTVAGPGFINISLTKKAFHNLYKSVVYAPVFHEGKKVNTFGLNDKYQGKTILVEHSSPNLFKPFHIGHMMNNAIGESLVRLMKFSGARVTTMSFPSDISLGIAKAVYALCYDLEMKKRAENATGLDDHIIAGDAYVVGTMLYEESEDVQVKVKEIADTLYAYTSRIVKETGIIELQNNDNEKNLWEKIYLTFSLASQNYLFSFLKEKLDSVIDYIIYESEAGIVGKDLVVKNTPTIFTKSEGAIVFVPDESKKGLNTAVFINSQGNPTYEAKDLGLLDLKFERVHPDLSLFVTDHEQIPHFKIVLDAAEKINKDWVEKSIHVPHGRMTFKGQKMSSRLGGVPLALEMIEDVAIEAKARMLHRDSDYGHIDTVSEMIAIAAIKFAILRAKPGQNINFDPDTSLSFEGDSGPYLQYTHARISSLLEKGKGLGFTPEYSTLEEVTDLERVVLQFSTVVDHAITEYAPQHIVTYLLELARSFNSYYGSNKFLDLENSQSSCHRLALAKETQQILKNGLYLLGIDHAPDRM